jgi:hypothetical protein
MKGDPTSFEEALRSAHSSKWQGTMKAKVNSMNTNDVLGLRRIPNGAKTIGYKWVHMTKCDSRGNVERYKTQLVVKGFTQREGIDYNESFFSSLMQRFF